MWLKKQDKTFQRQVISMLKWKKTELAMSTMSNKILVINTEWKKPCFIILALGRHKYQLVPTILIVVCLFALYNLFPISQPTPYILIIWLCSCLHLQILLAKGKHFPVSSCRLKNMDELLCHGTVGGIWLKKKRHFKYDLTNKLRGHFTYGNLKCISLVLWKQNRRFENDWLMSKQEKEVWVV